MRCTGKLLKIEPTPSEMYGEDNQLNVIKKPFEINWDKLNSEFDSDKNIYIL